MQIVIDIDEEDYKRIQDTSDVFNSLTSRAYSAIRNGTPLPKGHGRLTDMDEAIKCLEEVTDSKEKQYALYLIDWACSKRVLIEADKEGTAYEHERG